MECASRVLAVCTGARNLALWKWNFPGSHFAGLRLRSLDACFNTFHNLSKLHRIFPDLTHLTIARFPDDVVIPGLEWLPALTHMRFEVGSRDDLVLQGIRVAVRTSRRLQSIVIRVEDSDEWYYDRAQVEVWAGEDSRVIIEQEFSDYKAVRDWEERVACYVV